MANRGVFPTFGIIPGARPRPLSRTGPTRPCPSRVSPAITRFNGRSCNTGPTTTPQRPVPTARPRFPINRRGVGHSPRARLGGGFAFSSFIPNSSGHFTHAITLTITRNSKRSFGPLYVCNKSNLNGARLLGTVNGCTLIGSPKLGIQCIASRRFAGRFVSTLRGPGRDRNRVTRFGHQCQRISILLVSSVRFLNNGRTALSRFFRAFGTLRRTGGHVIVTSSMTPGGLGNFRTQLVSHFRSNLAMSIGPPSLRAQVTVLHVVTSVGNSGVPDSILSLVTRHFARGVHRLRNTLAHIATITSLDGRPIAHTLTRRALRSFFAASIRVGPASVVDRITGCFRLAFRSLINGSQAGGITIPHRVTVCLTHRVADVDLVSVNRIFNKHSRAAMVRTYAQVDSQVRRGRRVCGCIVRLAIHLGRDGAG